MHEYDLHLKNIYLINYSNKIILIYYVRKSRIYSVQITSNVNVTVKT